MIPCIWLPGLPAIIYECAILIEDLTFSIFTIALDFQLSMLVPFIMIPTTPLYGHTLWTSLPFKGVKVVCTTKTFAAIFLWFTTQSTIQGIACICLAFFNGYEIILILINQGKHFNDGGIANAKTLMKKLHAFHVIHDMLQA